MTQSIALAVDFGGTKVEAGLVDGDGRLVAGSRTRSATGRLASGGQLEESVAAAVNGALAALAPGTELAGTGIGAAGPIRRAPGLISPLNLPQWRDFPLRDFVAALVHEQHPGTEVRLEMDGLAITLAEHWVGAAQGLDNVMGMVISTGIGGGVIASGRAVTGRSGNAGHVGHLELSGFTGELTYGHPSSLEAVASGPNTVAWARAQGFPGSTGEDLARAYAAGDAIAIAALRRTGSAVGQAIGSATALLDLELVAIGGGFSHVSPDLFDLIRAEVAGHYLEFVRGVSIVPSALSGEGPLIGAGALIHRSWLLH